MIILYGAHPFWSVGLRARGRVNKQRKCIAVISAQTYLPSTDSMVKYYDLQQAMGLAIYMHPIRTPTQLPARHLDECRLIGKSSLRPFTQPELEFLNIRNA